MQKSYNKYTCTNTSLYCINGKRTLHMSSTHTHTDARRHAVCVWEKLHTQYLISHVTCEYRHMLPAHSDAMHDNCAIVFKCPKNRKNKNEQYCVYKVLAKLSKAATSRTFGTLNRIRKYRSVGKSQLAVDRPKITSIIDVHFVSEQVRISKFFSKIF